MEAWSHELEEWRPLPLLAPSEVFAATADVPPLPLLPFAATADLPPVPLLTINAERGPPLPLLLPPELSAAAAHSPPLPLLLPPAPSLLGISFNSATAVDDVSKLPLDRDVGTGADFDLALAT